MVAILVAMVGSASGQAVLTTWSPSQYSKANSKFVMKDIGEHVLKYQHGLYGPEALSPAEDVSYDGWHNYTSPTSGDEPKQDYGGTQANTAEEILDYRDYFLVSSEPPIFSHEHRSLWGVTQGGSHVHEGLPAPGGTLLATSLYFTCNSEELEQETIEGSYLGLAEGHSKVDMELSSNAPDPEYSLDVKFKITFQCSEPAEFEMLSTKHVVTLGDNEVKMEYIYYLQEFKITWGGSSYYVQPDEGEQVIYMTLAFQSGDDAETLSIDSEGTYWGVSENGDPMVVLNPNHQDGVLLEIDSVTGGPGSGS